MRDILRRVRRQRSLEKRDSRADSDSGASLEKTGGLGRKMRDRIVQAVAAIGSAEEDGRKHVCLTDPDARMLGEGRTKQIKECHSFEIATDNGLIIAAGVTTKQDTDRLLSLVKMAKKNEPEGIETVDGDCGFWKGDSIAERENSGIETCLPNIATACGMRRGLPIGTTLAKQMGKVLFTYEESEDLYRCPEGNNLIFLQKRLKYGQTVRIYRAERSCEGCCRKSECLTQKTAKRRTLSVALEKELITHVLARFHDLAHQERYHRRAPSVETVFGFVRNVLGFSSWLLRSSSRVSCEASLFKTAYQLRKVQTQIGKRQNTAAAAAAV